MALVSFSVEEHSLFSDNSVYQTWVWIRVFEKAVFIQDVKQTKIIYDGQKFEPLPLPLVKTLNK